MRPSFFHHLHPPTIPAAQSRWCYTLGAGGTAVFLVLVLVVTGALEMFYYVPTPGEAARSVQVISYLVPFGGLVRNLHYWAAQLLLLVSAVHLARIVFTGAYAPPRRFNYLLGLALFVLAILLDFTGYILRWDQGIQWALVVGTNLLKTIPLIGDSLYIFAVGGTQPGLPTLTRFYAWHIFGLMLVFVFLIGWHAFRVRRDGGIAVPPPNLRADKARISRYELVRREVLAMLFTGAALLLLATFVPAPIAAPLPASVSIPESVTESVIQSAPIRESVTESVDTSVLVRDSVTESVDRAPWFFLWVQRMLQWGDPFVWGVLVPLGLLLILALIPYVFPQPAEQELGRWFPRSNRLAQVVLGLIALLVLALTLLGSLPIS